MTGPALRVENLSLRLGRNLVLDGLDFGVAGGEIHCLIGPNGGGKTSTLRCLLGQMPHQGTIHLDWYGEDRTIAYVPQLLVMERSLPLTVLDFMALAAQDRPAFAGLSRRARARVEEALGRVELAGKEAYQLGGLSGGERQRLLFAQALIPAPSLLLLDEPMTSLDEGGARLIERLILDINAAGATVLWVNHDLGQVARLAHSITAIDGRVLAHGPTAAALSPEMRAGAFPRAARAGRD